MFYGPGGSGKTTLAAKHSNRLLFLDMDERLHELNMSQEDRNRIKCWIPNATLGSKEVQFTVIDPKRKDMSKGTHIAEEPRGYRRLVDIINELLQVSYKGEFPYDAVVLDSLTRVSEHLEYLVMYSHNMTNMTETLYGVVKRNLKELMYGFLRLPCDRILIAHSKHIEKRDRESGVILQSYTRPNVTGTMAEELMTFFSEVYYFLGRSGVEPIYKIQTATDRELAARTTKALAFQNVADPVKVFA
jgi:hypothetical protein